jgi:hypothetical protein
MTSKIRYLFLALFILLAGSPGLPAAPSGPACNGLFIDPWFNSSGIHRKKLFSDSSIVEKPIEMTITVQDWNNVHANAKRENAHSAAKFQLGEIILEGSVQARGQSRFNLFRTRALTFLIGDGDLKVVNRNGGFKDQPKLSSRDQNARVLVEYLIYKIHEIVFKEESVKTRLGLMTYMSPDGKVLDRGYGFFLEGKGQLSKRLHYDESTSWEFPHDSGEAISGNIFRALILDGDRGNMMNNFIYMKDKTDPKIVKRVAYDFDFSFIAPPKPIKTEDIPNLAAVYRDWLEKSYEIGTTSDHEYPPPPIGTKAQQAQALKKYRNQIILSAQKITDQVDLIMTKTPWHLLPGTYKITMKSWFEAALKETQSFIDAHKNDPK